MRRLVLAVLTIAIASARAQTIREDLLTHLGRTADDLDHRLPNFSCEESGISEQLQHGKSKHRVKFTTTVRARRNASGALEESTDKITTDVSFLQSLRYGPNSVPLFLAGGFSQALDYFLPDAQHCFDYKLSEGRIDFHSLRPAPRGCIEPTLSGFALVDPAGDITHVERTVTHDGTERHSVITFAAIDFAPVDLNGHTFRLPQHVLGEEPGDETGSRRFTADYTHCQLFTATITLHTGEPPPPEPAPHP